MYSDWVSFEEAVKKDLEKSGISGNEVIANYYENPHFDPIASNLIISLSPEKKVSVERNSWDKTESQIQFGNTGQLPYPPKVSYEQVLVPGETGTRILGALEALYKKENWLQEPIYLDGIFKELKLFLGEEPKRIVWNMRSNNEELNQFSELMQVFL